MQRVILFRFHAYESTCQNRLRLLKRYNSHIPIFGLFGGLEKYYGRFQKKLTGSLEHIYCLQNKTKEWKWRNGDLAVRLWFDAVGRHLSFDMLHLIEWDLLLLDPIDKIYRDIPHDTVGLTAITPATNVEGKWIWTSKDPYKEEWNALLKWVKKKFNFILEPCVTQGPGICLPRKFLEAYSMIEVPELCNDEARLPLFSQALGFTMRDTGFINGWLEKNDGKTFHCRLFPEIDLATIKKELADPSGKRAFHPFRKTFTLEGRISLFTLIIESLRSGRKRLVHSARHCFS